MKPFRAGRRMHHIRREMTDCRWCSFAMAWVAKTLKRVRP